MILDGVVLRKLREVYRLTREDMGALMDVSGRFVSYVEHGDRKLPEDRADILERKLSLTPDKLARLIAIYDETTLNPTATVGYTIHT